MPSTVSLPALAGRLGAGGSIFIPGASSEPVELTRLLAAEPGLAAGARFVAPFVPGMNRQNLAAAASGRRMRAFFMPPDYHRDWAAGLVEFSPLSYFGVHRYVGHAESGIATVVVQVAEPGREGLCSLGAAGELVPSAIRAGVSILAIVNPHVPQIPGALRVPYDSFECVAHSSAPLATYDAGASNATAEAIAAHLAALVPDGASLQVGLGKVPAQLLLALRSHRRLRLSSGMLSDSFVALAESGALDPDAPIVVGMIVGSAALYPRLAAIRGLRMAPVSETHDPVALAAVPRLHAINSALEVDLLGQANAEVQAGRYVSGPGGLPDFAAAAHRSAEGLSVIALPSADASGRHSRIVAEFAAGTPVTVPKHDVDVVVTEYGVAMLKLQPLEERATRLAAIAHPAHRENLVAAAKRIFR